MNVRLNPDFIGFAFLCLLLSLTDDFPGILN